MRLRSASARRVFSISKHHSRGAATAAKHSPGVLSRGKLLTLIHKTERLLPRILPSEGPWVSLLQSTYEDLDAQATSPAHVVVYGVDEWSGAQDLVTAFLEEPFGSDETQTNLIRNRWKDGWSRITLNEAHSPRLSQYTLPVELVEIQASSKAAPKPNTHDISSLFVADVPIIVFNPLTTPLSTLLADDRLPWYNPRTILVISNFSTPPPTSLLLKDSSTPQSPVVTPEMKACLQELKIVSIDPQRAIGALNILKANSTSATSIQRYQDDYLGSGIPSLSHTLRECLEAQPTTDNSFSDHLNSRSVSRLRGALLACKAQIRKLKADLNTVYSCVSDLEKEVATVQEGVGLTIFEIKYPVGRPKPPNSPTDLVEAALKRSEREMKVVMDRLNWWRMVSHVDEIGTLVGEAVSRTWCKDLDTQLLMHTGQLASLQQRLTSTTLGALSRLPLPTSVLRNSLLQTSTSPSYPLTQKTLVAPLNRRRAQIDYPTTRLHLAAQRATLGMFSSVGVGAGVSWAGWVGWLSESSSLIALDATTALGTGVLTALVGVRWAIGRWEKAKKRWWEDWLRVGDGLSRDLKANLARVISNNVVVLPETASVQLLELAEKRKNEIADLEDELDTLGDDFQNLEERV
ncbi:hypothetical protein ONZ45_g8732 [Pleurotus djamor]|nr:hypothetical protein ONZ45_g8732 [Pleurotus djamor]